MQRVWTLAVTSTSGEQVFRPHHANLLSLCATRYECTAHSWSILSPNSFLMAQNITALACAPTRVFALSASGNIYALSSSDAQASSADKPLPASSSWFGTGYLWGEIETADFAEVTPDVKLGWNEKYVLTYTHLYAKRPVLTSCKDS